MAITVPLAPHRHVTSAFRGNGLYPTLRSTAGGVDRTRRCLSVWIRDGPTSEATRANSTMTWALATQLRGAERLRITDK